MALLPRASFLLIFQRLLLWANRLVDTMDLTNIVYLDFNIQPYYLELYAVQETKFVLCS